MEAATAQAIDAAAPSRDKKAWWNELLEPYAGADMRRSLSCLATSVLPYLALWPAMYYLLQVSDALALAVTVLASGFLLRTYIVFHDCTHGSFMPTKRANTWLGVMVGILVYSPFHSWRQEHAAHHATSGDLDRRGLGDVDTWTVAEYTSKSWPSRLGYRLIRNPIVMLTLGPLWALALEPRLIPLKARRRIQRSHLYTDIALAAAVTGVIWVIGWRDFLLLQAPMILIAGGAGVWLFYVQHQFEGAYWTRKSDWSFEDAALKGSSYLRLPKVLQFFTGNIGLHHVHHLCPRIPNYNLQRAHDANQFLHGVPTLSFWDGLRTMRLKLFDEQTGRLVTFAQARRGAAIPA